MAYQNDDLLAFRQLRAQAARKKQLETQRAALTDRCQVLSVQAEACRKARQAAEQEVATLESKGPMGLLYTIAGDKAKRLDEARQTLRKARADDQQASWDLAQAQVDLAQTERGLEIDGDGFTKEIPNLLVAGEAAGGIHGRNRLMGNSLLDVIVFGRNAGKKAAAKCKEVELGEMNLDHIYAYEKELKAAGAETDKVSPLLLPNYARHEQR